MKMETSKKLFRAYKRDLKKCKSINEIMWIEADFKSDMNIWSNELDKLMNFANELKANFKAAGDRYTRARRPEFKK